MGCVSSRQRVSLGHVDVPSEAVLKSSRTCFGTTTKRYERAVDRYDVKVELTGRNHGGRTRDGLHRTGTAGRGGYNIKRSGCCSGARDKVIAEHSTRIDEYEVKERRTGCCCFGRGTTRTEVTMLRSYTVRGGRRGAASPAVKDAIVRGVVDGATGTGTVVGQAPQPGFPPQFSEVSVVHPGASTQQVVVY